jgi:hypothetical protein
VITDDPKNTQYLGIYLRPSTPVHEIVMLELVTSVTVTWTNAGRVIAVKGSDTVVNLLTTKSVITVAVAVTVITGLEPGVNPELNTKVLGTVVDDPAVNVGTSEVSATAQVYVVPGPVHGHVTVVLFQPQVPCVITGFVGGIANTTFADPSKKTDVDCLIKEGVVLYAAMYRFLIEPGKNDVDGIVVVYPPPPSVAATGTGDSVVIHGIE